jgi:hypothetical protein
MNINSSWNLLQETDHWDCPHSGRVCVRVIIGMSVRALVSVCVVLGTQK